MPSVIGGWRTSNIRYISGSWNINHHPLPNILWCHGTFVWEWSYLGDRHSCDNLGFQEWKRPPERLFFFLLPQTPHPAFTHQEKKGGQRDSQVGRVEESQDNVNVLKLVYHVWGNGRCEIFFFTRIKDEFAVWYLIAFSVSAVTALQHFFSPLLKAALALVNVCGQGGLKISRVSSLSSSMLAGRSPGESCRLRVQCCPLPHQQKLLTECVLPS